MAIPTRQSRETKLKWHASGCRAELSAGAAVNRHKAPLWMSAPMFFQRGTVHSQDCIDEPGGGEGATGHMCGGGCVSRGGCEGGADAAMSYDMVMTTSHAAGDCNSVWCCRAGVFQGGGKAG